MVKVLWEPNGPPSADDKLAELGRMREKYQRERPVDEEYCAARMRYVEHAEATIHARRNPLPSLAAMRQHAVEAARELGETQPFAYPAVAQRLKDCGYESWQVSKLIQYASFIQARGWEAFYPEDAAFLRQKYADAGVDPEKIDFRS